MQPVNCLQSDQRSLPLPLAVAGRSAYRLTLARSGEPDYDRACDLAADQYQRHFGCALRDHYPAYFCLENQGQLLGVCGFRAATGQLFLEQYLEAPVETLLPTENGHAPSRSEIVELGAFAVRHRGLALLLMNCLAPALQDMGFVHAVCTATLPVRRCLRTLGISAANLGRAEASCLSNSESDWGSYYSMRPAVIHGAIALTADSLRGVFEGGV